MEHNLEHPFYLRGDLDKPLWKIINENSLSLASLGKHILNTEAVMSNGMTLFSSPDDHTALNAFNLKEIMLIENQNISFINKIELKFNEKKDASRKVITLKADEAGYVVGDLDRIMNEFLKEWQ
jgi:hypothetical protein